MSDRRSLRSQSPTKRRSLVATNIHRTQTPPASSSRKRSPDPANMNKRSAEDLSNKQYSDPIPVLEPSAPYKVSVSPSPQSDNSLFDQTSPNPNVSASSEDKSPPQQPKDQPINVKVVAIGDGNTGKTCLLVTYGNGYFPETYVPTVFENYLTQVRGPNGKLIELALWDTAGQEEYDRLRALSYPEVDVLLVCFAVDAPASLDNVYDKWIPEITHYCPDEPFILVGLKTDLRNDMTSQQHLRSKGQRALTYEEGKKAAQQCGAYKYMECSAKNREGVNEIFNQAISIVLKGQRNSGIRKVSGLQSSQSQRRALPRPPNSGITDTDAAQYVYADKKTKKRHKCVIL